MMGKNNKINRHIMSSVGGPKIVYISRICSSQGLSLSSRSEWNYSNTLDKKNMSKTLLLINSHFLLKRNVLYVESNKFCRKTSWYSSFSIEARSRRAKILIKLHMPNSKNYSQISLTTRITEFILSKQQN